MTTPAHVPEPHPIADIICAWANGFRVEFRYRHHNPGIPEEIYLSDERWHLCGKAYSAWSGINEHRIHADDLAAWEAFKHPDAAAPSLTVGERAEPAADWVLAMAKALGMDSGFRIPIVPDVEAFKDLFAAVRASAVQPATQAEPVAWADEIIDDLHALHDSELITENDSGDALVRLDAAICAVQEAAERAAHPAAQPMGEAP